MSQYPLAWAELLHLSHRPRPPGDLPWLFLDLLPLEFLEYPEPYWFLFGVFPRYRGDSSLLGDFCLLPEDPSPSLRSWFPELNLRYILEPPGEYAVPFFPRLQLLLLGCRFGDRDCLYGDFDWLRRNLGEYDCEFRRGGWFCELLTGKALAATSSSSTFDAAEIVESSLLAELGKFCTVWIRSPGVPASWVVMT